MFPKVQCATPCCRLAAISRFGGFLRRWSVAALALLLWLPASEQLWQIGTCWLLAYASYAAFNAWMLRRELAKSGLG